MPSDQITFAGVELSSGRKLVTFAALDDGLNILAVEKWDIPETLSCLKDYENIWVAINMPMRAQETYNDFKKKLSQSGFRSYSNKNDPKQFLVTNAQDCFHALSGHKLFPQRGLEGRLQRSAILYEQGLQITDPIDIFEEITRYKLIQGILPLENIYSAKELDALVAAYLAWIAVNRPGQIVLKGEFALPAPE
jgi:hypothetical protein